MEPDLGKKYSITKRISKGKFGNVYLGLVTKTQEKIAIKQSILNLIPTAKPQTQNQTQNQNQNGNGSSGLGQNIETIKHEAEMLSFLAANTQCRPHIPFISWYGLCSQGNYCMVMSYIPHTPLTPTSIRTNTQTNEKAVHNMPSMIVSIIKALYAIHEQGIVHRDLKPENILYHQEKRKWMLIDFGLSSFYQDEQGNHNPPASKPKRHILGTPNFVSTFVHQGEEPSRRDDLIALGNVAWWLANNGLWTPPPETLENIIKMKTQIQNLAKSSPTPEIKKDSGLDVRLMALFHHCYQLKYTDKPNYTLILSYFQ
jgi:serine/threonine protein kinase